MKELNKNNVSDGFEPLPMVFRRCPLPIYMALLTLSIGLAKELNLAISPLFTLLAPDATINPLQR